MFGTLRLQRRRRTPTLWTRDRPRKVFEGVIFFQIIVQENQFISVQSKLVDIRPRVSPRMETAEKKDDKR